PGADGRGQRQAHHAAGVPHHEVDRLRGDGLGGDDQVALVLPVFVVHEDDHAAGPQLGERLLDRAEAVARLGHVGTPVRLINRWLVGLIVGSLTAPGRVDTMRWRPATGPRARNAGPPRTLAPRTPCPNAASVCG